MVKDLIYAVLGFMLLVTAGITIIGFVAFLLGVPASRIEPILTGTVPLAIGCTVIGLWKRQVFAAMFSFMMPF